MNNEKKSFFKKNSLFVKFVIVFTFVLVFGFSISGILVYVFAGNFLTSEKQKILEKSADQFAAFISDNRPILSNPSFIGYMQLILKTNRINTNSYTFIADTDGYLVLTEDDDIRYSLPVEILNRLSVDKKGKYKFSDERQYKTIMAGEQERMVFKGDFYGLFSLTKMPWLTVAKVIKAGDRIIGAVYLNMPVPEIQRARVDLYRFYLISVLIATVISVIAAYLFSRRLTKPLKEISVAAAVISGGEFNRRINYKTDDEIGDLVKSFNSMVYGLEKLEESRRDFVANVSHELRTPMTSIHGFIEGIIDGTIPVEKHNYYLTIIRDEIMRLNRLANDLLDLAKIESGEIVLNFRIFDINELARMSIIKLEGFITAKNIEIQANFEEEKMLVRADKDAVERIFLNLIHNAIKFTPEYGIVSIKTQRSKEAAIISVQDSGPGIEETEKDLIFDRFYKSDKSRSGNKGGTGLGLAIVKNLVVLHRQKIWVESEADEGAAFYFTLELY